MTEQPTRREQYAAAIRPAMLLGLQDAELYDEPGTQRVNEWVDWIAKTLADLPSPRRTLTPNEHSAAWHAIEGTAAEEGADPDTVLNAVLRALDIDPPA